MAIEFNATMNQFVNWANRDGIGKTDLVHAKKTQGTTGDAKIAIVGNTGDGIGFFASRRRSADTKEMNNATRELFKQAVMDLFGAQTIDGVPKSVRGQGVRGKRHQRGRPRLQGRHQREAGHIPWLQERKGCRPQERDRPNREEPLQLVLRR